ncbi:MAG: SIR2 family protein [Colwellia sp.]|nr:SIR2 family protein [Colwellia sp.]
MEKISPSIRPYLDEISQCLWSKNASIMVGAGFSMNAKAMFDNAKRFPSWQDLGNIFYKKVRGEEIQNAKYNFFDPLKLAYEVESNFGRSVLDSILRTNIPDSDYKPSDLHQALLRLPWTDVFTTNYDTLLERAAETVSERNYKVVVHKDNLVHSTPPRIVKLHGCFSASTPLIISEEDYRTYPQNYAPFVNTVQQTLLENTLCLIGFSGDDPNFLKWIGWIRDNLGEKNAPKIYLVGVLNLSTSQEKSLSQYNITCIDMALCDGIGEHDHQAGIRKFINYCESRKDDESQKGWELSGKLTHSRFTSTNVPNADDVHNELNELIELWEVERLSYPNWLVAPNELRRKLWAYTSNWSSIFNKSISISLPILKNFVYEFLWRKEKSLLPIFDHEVDLIRSSIKSGFSDDNVADDRIFHIALALLRYYREEGKKEEWQDLFNTVNSHFKGQKNSDYLTYERALHLLIDNKSVELIQLLSRWSAGSSSVIWMYRKASILAEINKLTDAQDNLEKALIKTRRKINAATSIVDYANVSLESYILVLLTNVNHALSIKAGDWSPTSKQEYLERLNELRQFQCNPWQEIQLLELEIKHEQTPLKSISVINGFDIGSQHTTHHLSGENTEALNAFRLLRFFEDAALPFSLPRMNIAVTGANNAIKRVATYAPHWSMSTMLRTRDKKSTELIFTRESLSKLDSTFIDGLAKRYIELLSIFMNEENSLYEYGTILPEALSRLCCRVTLDVKDELLNLIAKIYSNKPTSHKYQSIDKLVKRLILSYSDKEIIQRIEQVTNIAYYVVVNDGKEVDIFTCPNPFNYFLNLSVPDLTNKKLEVKLSTDKVKSFLNGMESENKEVRQNASLTLIRLKNLGLLNKTQVRSLLSKLLYHQDKYGLPESTGYYKFAYIELFDGKSDIEKAFRKYFLDASPLIQVNTSNPKSYGMSGRSDTFTNELVGSSKLINWSDDELHIHAQKLLNWWKSDKVIFENNDTGSDFIKEMNNRFSLFVECTDVIVIQNNLTEYKEAISQMASEFQMLGLDYLCLKAAAINYIDFDKEEYLKEIEDALSTFEEQHVFDALWAINRLLCKSSETDSRYLDLLVTFIKYSRGQYLTSAFQVVINILIEKNYVLSTELESAALKALSRIIVGFKGLDFEENLALRKSGAKLASKLSIVYILGTSGIPEVISKWRAICDSSDEFSEVKNQWTNHRKNT